METRKQTTAGVVVWTPAPAPTSPTSSVIYEDVWEDENGEQAEEEDDFVSQMDENGIIGLSGALKNVELVEACGDEDSECNPGCYPALLASEKLFPGGCKSPEKMSHSLRDHLSDTELPDYNMTGSTPEELAAPPGIDAETFPEMDSTESLPDSHSSLKSSPCCPRTSENKVHQATAVSPKQLVSWTCSLQPRRSPDRDSGTQRVNTNTKAAVVHESKKGAPSYRTPDFSKVEPRVRFPKSGYTPPKSRLSSTKDFPWSPVVYKSPAEIVKEVLLASDQPPSASACDKPPAGALGSTVPQDFRSWQQAATLLEQLQEDYNRLLTKYAEAENTIDRLRLEAKVNLCSDPPNPRHVAQPGRQDASKWMTLDFPQAQKAANNSASLSNGHSSPQKQVDNFLYIQADGFLQQLQAYQDLLRREKLQPPEQMRGFIQLAEGLDALERGYILAKDDHKRLQQQGTKASPFDPERKLERLIYQCGLHMDELKEQVEKTQREQTTCEAPPSPSSDFNPSCIPSDKGKHCPQAPSVSSVVDHGGEVEVSSVSEDSEQTVKDDDDDEIFKSFYLKPVTGKHRWVAKDSVSVLDGNIKSNHKSHPPLHTSKQQSSRCFPSLPVHLPSSSRRLAVGKSHSASLSSLGEVTTSESKTSRHQAGSSKLLCQDGVVSPEADSGFVGSESSPLTPLAAWSPLHQRAPESEAVQHEEKTPKLLTVTATSSASSPSHSHVETEHSEFSHLSPDQQIRSRRHTFSSSPQHWVIQTEQPRVSCGFGLGSNTTHSASEDGQSDQFNKSITSVHTSHASSPPSMQHHHGNSRRAPGSSHVAKRNAAMQLLQAEVTTLKERLESCLAKKMPHGSVRAAPPAPCCSFIPHTRPEDEQQNDGSRGGGQTCTEHEGTRRSVSAHRQKAQPDIFSPRPQISRCTQTVETNNYSHTSTGYNRAAHTDGNTDGACSFHCRHSPVGVRTPTDRRSKQECTSCRPAESPDKAVRSTFVAAPGAVLQCLPMCPPPILLYSSPIYASPSNSPGTTSAVRGRGGPLTAEVRQRNRRSLSADKNHSLDRSLNRAIRAAQHMKNTSRRMAHSLATGLEYQDLLAQSCSY